MMKADFPAISVTLFDRIGAILWRDRWVFGLIALHWLVTVSIITAADLPYENSAIRALFRIFTILMPVYLLVLLIWRIIAISRANPGKRPIPILMRDLREIATDFDGLLRGAFMLVGVSIFFGNFSVLKLSIPQLNPFGWDLTFAGLDAALHFGTDPWRYFWSFLGNTAGIHFLNAVYVFWLFLLYFVNFAGAFTRTDPQLRRTYFIAFLLTWGLGGNLLATLFSSVGPCFYGPLGLGDRFAPLMVGLQAIHAATPITSLDVQQMLWAGYATGEGGKGISAFPSMHVASSMLLALYAMAWRRWAGWMMMVFVGLVQLATIMLGWHYAIDGYAGIIVAFLAWWGAGRIARLGN
ncbi:MAG: phosphatase PAP2 family protein [Pseudorhodobacter sp.]